MSQATPNVPVSLANASRAFCGLWLLLLGAGTGCSHSCTEMGCSGELIQLALVDDAGDPVAAKGEYRASTGHTDGLLVAFDCTPDAPASENRCVDGGFQVGPAWAEDFVLEVRFALPDGELTEWQAVPVEITARTDPDFNGPDCPCTSYDGSAEPIVVPEGAR